ncbi:MAG: aromatic ring-hydroxylating dioxygenase subunit alpha [Rugosibacter sp.]|nr:MAG: aromatic ring-hydroxylating dioxygenase subunit alpha [Rugosibacter sp.]
MTIPSHPASAVAAVEINASSGAPRNNSNRNPTAGSTRQSYQHLFRPGFVHRRLYVDEQIFHDELRYLYGRTWLYIGHESEVPQPNDFIARRVGGRPLILVHTQAGEIRVLFNRCPHRGAIVCRETHGNAKGFICGYHAWTFANDGHCSSVPLRQGYGADFNLHSVDLAHPAKVDRYRGFIFAAFTSDVPSLTEHLGPAADLLDQWLDRGDRQPVVVRSGSMPFLVHANWKTIYDNAGDGYHPPFSHESMLTVFSRRYGDVDMNYYGSDFDKSPMYSKNLGNGHTFLDQRPEMHKLSAWKRQHVMPGYEAIEKALIDRLGETRALQLLDASTGSGMNLNIFPNLLIIGNQIQMPEPLAVNQTQLTWFSTTLDGAPDEINAVRMRMQEDFPSFGEVDDAGNFEACQQGMESVPEMEWIDIRRHINTARGGVDPQDGLWREPMSSDLHMRTYFQRWQELMNTGKSNSLAEENI